MLLTGGITQEMLWWPSLLGRLFVQLFTSSSGLCPWLETGLIGNSFRQQHWQFMQVVKGAWETLPLWLKSSKNHAHSDILKNIPAIFVSSSFIMTSIKDLNFSSHLHVNRKVHNSSSSFKIVPHKLQPNQILLAINSWKQFFLIFNNEVELSWKIPFHTD